MGSAGSSFHQTAENRDMAKQQFILYNIAY